MRLLWERQPIIQRSRSPQGNTPSSLPVNRLLNSEYHESTSKEIWMDMSTLCIIKNDSDIWFDKLDAL